MKSFSEIVAEKADAYGVADIIEELNASEQGIDPVASNPNPTMQSTGEPNVEQGAESQEEIFDKPYKTMGKTLYAVLNSDIEDLRRTHPDVYAKISNMTPDDIRTENDASALFAMAEQVVKRPLGESFAKVVEQKAKEFSLELFGEDLGANNGGAMGDGQMDAEMPSPEPEIGTPPAGGGEAQREPLYNPPYQDLAKTLYGAWMLNIDDLRGNSPSLYNKIMNLHPDDIKSQAQGAELFKVVERVLAEYNGLEEEEQIEGDNSTFGPGAS